MMNGIEYIDYDKISDDLCWLGNKCIARMVVKLSSKGKDNTRYHFHKEFKYPTNYINQKEAITIRRSFEYYISIDSLDSKSSVIVTVRDILLLRSQISQVFHWFYDDTFAIKNNRMIILHKRKPIIVDGLLGNKYLSFEPIIYIDLEDKQSKGIRMNINDQNVYTDMPANVFAGFMYIINSIDMFTAAQNMINYIGHPDFGTNLLTFEKAEYASDDGETKVSNVIKERKIKSKKQQKSYFDNLDDL